MLLMPNLLEANSEMRPAACLQPHRGQNSHRLVSLLLQGTCKQSGKAVLRGWRPDAAFLPAVPAVRDF